MERKEARELFSRMAKDYDRIVEDSKYASHKVVARMVLGALKKEKARILDLGCGTGLSSHEFFGKGWDVTGVDAAEEMIVEAGKLPFSNLITQDIEARLQVRSRSFDAAVMVGVTEFIKNLQALLNEIRRVLKKGGLLALTIPQKSPSRRIRSYEQEEAEKIFANAGYAILDHAYFKAYQPQSIEDPGIFHHGYLLRKQ